MCNTRAVLLPNMLRVLVIVLAIGLSVSQRPGGAAYRPGREYVYDYVTQVLTGIPGGSKIYSGLKIKAAARIQFETASRTLITLENIRAFKINDYIDGPNPTRQQIPDSMFTEITGPEVEDIRQKLGKPLKFSYIRGHVTDIQSEADDPYWSLNMKRGILSIMEVNMDERKSLSNSPPKVDRTPGPQDEFYTVVEPSVAGECETLYKRRPEVSKKDEPWILLTKVRNYKNCLSRPEFSHTIFDGMFCAECEKDRTEPLWSASKVRYELKGSNRRFQIQSAIAESEHVFTPFSPGRGSVATFINQTFELVDSKASSARPIQQLKSPQSHKSGLQATLPRTMVPGDPMIIAYTPGQSPESLASSITCAAQRSPMSPAEQERIKTKITKLLFTIAAFTNTTVSEETGELVMQMTEELRKADRKVLGDIWKLYEDITIHDPVMKRRRKILFDTLPTAGTSAAVYILEGAIEAKQLLPEEATRAMGILALHCLPDTCVEKGIKAIMKLPMVQHYRPLKSSAWLCYGAVVDKVHKSYTKMSSRLRQQKLLAEKVERLENQPKIKQELKAKITMFNNMIEQSSRAVSKLKEDFIHMLRELLRSAEINDKILAMKALGNAGIHEVLTDVATIINNKNNPYILRAHAIFSLQKMIYMIKKPIYEALLPRYFDLQEPEDIRIPAFFMIAMTRPPLPVLQMLAESLHRETNPHVGTFVYSYIEQMSNSTHPCLMAFAKNASFALLRSKKFTSQYHYSRYMHVPFYSDKLKSGFAVNVATISSSKEFLPRAGAAAIDFQFLGADGASMEFGFITEGMQKLLSKLIGPDGELTRGKSPADLLKPVQRPGSEPSSEEHEETKPRREQIKNIHDQIKVSPRESSEPEGNVYFRMYGNEVFFMPINKESVNRMLEEGIVEISHNERDLRNGVRFNVFKSMVFGHAEHYFATEAGVPMRLNLRMSGVTKVDGTMRIIAEPALFQKNRKGRQSNIIKSEFELYPSAVFDLDGKMEMDAFYYTSGAMFNGRLHANTPLAFSYGYDIKKMKHLASIDVARLNEKMMKYEMIPFTYVNKEPIDIKNWPSTPDMKNIDSAEQAITKTVAYDWGKYHLGMNFAIKGQIVSRNFLREVPYWPFSGRQLLYLTVSPGVNPPKQLDFEIMATYDLTSTPPEEPNQSSESKETSIFGLINRGVNTLSSILSLQSKKEQRETFSSEMSSLIEKFRNSTKIVEHAEKSGLVFRYMGMGSKPQRSFELNALLQKMNSGRERKLSFKVTRSPIPTKENEPWECDIDIDLSTPTVKVTPSSLIDPRYQSEVQKQIDIQIRQDGVVPFEMRLIDHLADQEKKIDRLESVAWANDLFDEIVRTIITKYNSSADTVLNKLTTIVKTQTRLQIHVDELRMNIAEKRNSHRLRPAIQTSIEQAEAITESLSSFVLPNSSSINSPEKAIVAKYLILKQQKILRRLQTISRRIQEMVSSEERQSIRTKIQSFEKAMTAIQQKQATLPWITASVSQTPGDKKLTEEVKELYNKQNKVILRLSAPQQRPLSEEQAQIIETISKTKEIQQALNGILQQSPNIDVRLEEGLIEIAVQHQQIIENMRQKINEYAVINSTMSPSQNVSSWGECVQQMQQLKWQYSKMVWLIAKLVSIRQEKESVWPLLKEAERAKMMNLQKIDIIQTIAMNDLWSSQQSLSLETQAVRAQQLERGMSKLRSSQEALNRIFLTSAGVPPPTIIKQVIIAQTQATLLKEVLDEASKELVGKTARDSEVSHALKQMKINAENMLIDHLTRFEKSMIAVKSKKPVTLQSNGSANAEPGENRPTTPGSRSNSNSPPGHSSAQPGQQSSGESSPLSRNEDLRKLLTSPQDLRMKMVISFGALSEHKKVIRMELLGKKTIEQLWWEMNQASPYRRDESVRRVLVEMDGSEVVKSSYKNLMEELNILRHFHVHAFYRKTDIPRYLRYAIWRYMDSMKFYMYSHITETFPDENWNPNTLEAYIDVKKNNKQMDVTLKTEYETSRFNGVYLPFPIRSIVGMLQNVEQPLKSKIHPPILRVAEKLPSTCELHRRRISTFDKKEYEIPDTHGCDVVLAMDCSPSHSFAVKVSEIPEEPERKAIKVLVDDRAIEVIPSANATTVKVDNEVRPLKDNEPVKITAKSGASKTKGQVIAEITKKSADITVMAKMHGVEVYTNGQTVSIKASPFHYSKICGLCGNYDGRTDNDHTDPQKRKEANIMRFVARYILSNDHCNATDIKQLYDQPKVGSAGEEGKAKQGCTPQLITKKITRSRRRGQSQICFSIKPVKRCKLPCRPAERKARMINYTCVDRTSSRARELEIQSSKKPLDLQGVHADYKRVYQEHESCRTQS